MTGELSYDLVMEDDMDFIEGCYRIENGAWQIVIMSKQPIEVMEVVPSSWESGATGIIIHVPATQKLNRRIVEEVLTSRLGVNKWREVRGPDSIHLR